MRKVFLTLAVLTTFINIAKSQSWIDLGLKGGWGPTILLNANAFDDKTFEHKISFGSMFGGKFGFNFNDDHEITFDAMFINNSQKYDFFVANADTTVGGTTAHKKTVNFSTLSFGLLYRHNKDGRHFEIGPVYNIVKKASVSNDNAENTLNDGTDIKSNLSPNFMSMLFGFGGYFMGTENFGITFGARFTYGLGDLISAEGKNRHFPYYTDYGSYKKTTPFTAMLVAEANLDFAYMAKAKCKNKRKLILF
jgi:hypothetical protein